MQDNENPPNVRTGRGYPPDPRFAKALPYAGDPADTGTGTPKGAYKLSMDAVLVIEELKRELQRYNSPWLTPREAAAYLGMSLSWLNTARDKGKIKAYTGKGTMRPRYRREDLDKLIQG